MPFCNNRAKSIRLGLSLLYNKNIYYIHKKTINLIKDILLASLPHVLYFKRNKKARRTLTYIRATHVWYSLRNTIANIAQQRN